MAMQFISVCTTILLRSHSFQFHCDLVCHWLFTSQEFSRFHPQIQPMFDGILNNRKEWNAKKEDYEAKLKAIEDEKAAKAAAAASKGERSLWNNHTTLRLLCDSFVECVFVKQLLPTTPAAAAVAPRRARCAERAKTCTRRWLTTARAPQPDSHQ